MKLENSLLTSLPFLNPWEVISQADRIFLPQPDLTISQWADARRKLSGKTSALPGDWDTSFNPMMREPMDCCSDPMIREITVVGPRQIAKTSLAENVVGYYMDYDPAQIGVFFENQEKADNWSKTRFMEMVRVSPCLQDKVVTGKGPTSANTVNYKDFPGGFLVILSAGSDANVASYSLRIVINDELSKYPKTKLGDTAKRIRALTTTFFNSKIINITTPTIWLADEQENSAENIQRCRGTERYLASDQRIPIMTCPACGFPQQMVEERFNFRDPGYKGTTIDEVWYNCENPKCVAGKIRELHKPRIIQTGKWVAQNPSVKDHAGFAHYPALWSPWVPWLKYGNEYLQAKRQPDTYQTFINEWRGEPFDPTMLIDKDISVYTKRCEDYTNVPGPAVLLTCGVDVHPDRLEAEVKAWSPDRESFGIEMAIFHGKPHLLTDNKHLPGVWLALDAFLQKTWVHEYGSVMGIDFTLIDQGYLMDEVQKFCKPRQGRNIRPCRGMSNTAHELVGRAQKNNRMRVKYFPIGPNRAKAIIFANAKTTDDGFEQGVMNGPGYMHWTRHGNFGDQYFKQLFLSERVVGIVGGVSIYDKITSNSQNHALDLNVYNLAAFELARPLIPIRQAQIAEAKKQWEKEQGKEAGEGKEAIVVQEQKKANVQGPRSNWVNRWKR